MTGFKMELYNTMGQLVTTLLVAPSVSGRHTLRIDFTENGIAPGSYFVKFMSPDKTMTLKVVDLKY